ncbi:ABC transporter ATP-binding protein [Candidatus Formimonas warabiya]|uniref:ABC transporter domain-containing protein n=1 Tax=Formimonas warabiya TaxID=1761012 RepID=A0A3G1KYB9_FORW1|nr:ABC transporter ATP-binding protein [Candidatus Formimonas warabiya]ATW27441.1 hypothetical protein DCMF_24195 [Candidatus Formimonas warabiya]
MTIIVNNLSFRYHDSSVKALKGIDLEAQPGELLFIIGGNASGKSTLLLCMAGIIPHLVTGELSGDILVDHIRMGENGIQQERPGMALQDSDTYLFEEVFQEIAYPLVNQGASQEEVSDSVYAASKSLGISRLLHRSMSTLSGGERQKVAIATALVTKSPVLLLDEPVEQLDPDAAHEVLTILQKMAREGKTVIVTGKQGDFARKYAGKIVFLDNGSSVRNISAAGNIFDDNPARHLSAPNLKVARESSCGEQLLEERDAGTLSPVVKFEKVTHLFQDGGGVEEIDFAIKPGEVIAIMGPNGAGKSTLLKHCLGLLRAQKGKTFIFGEDASALPSWKLAQKVGMLFQNPDDQIFNERVDKEVAWNLKVRGMTWEQALSEAKKVLEELGLLDLCEKHPHELIRSQRQLIALASVLVTHPDLIILDEPSKSLDHKHVREIMDRILQQRPSRGAVIIVTHDPALAWLYADRIALIVAGRLAGIGNTEDILLDHVRMEKAKLSRHPFVMDLHESNSDVQGEY